MTNAAIEDIRKVTYTVVSKLSGLPIGLLRDTADLRDDLALDSLKIAETFSRITESYDIRPDMKDLLDILTIGDIIEYLSKQLTARIA